jgi:H+-translocating NAD(P) transhydrogenase subunit alpha
MRLGVLKEANYKRVAIVPSSAKALNALGTEVLAETEAGVRSGINDADMIAAGFSISDRKSILAQSDLLVSIAPLSLDELSLMKAGASVISMYAPYQQPEILDTLKGLPLNIFSMDMVPRTTLAQSMDVLSSMASLAGYKAVVKAAEHYNNMFAMMMTAAGTVPPTKVMVIGAGVAGLQAIATARRLGAVVEAFDTRLAAKEEVQSLGATFVEVEGAVDDRGAGGYAVQQSDEYLQKQRALVHERALRANIIIATAQVRGRKAPLIVTEETIRQMRSGSVIVDLAASTGGNCAFTQNNKTIVQNGVVIIGNSDLADELSNVSSTLFSNNIINFLKILVKDGNIHIDEQNEIIKNALISKP